MSLKEFLPHCHLVNDVGPDASSNTASISERLLIVLSGGDSSGFSEPSSLQ
jgi:hypothetical protein